MSLLTKSEKLCLCKTTCKQGCYKYIYINANWPQNKSFGRDSFAKVSLYTSSQQLISAQIGLAKICVYAKWQSIFLLAQTFFVCFHVQNICGAL
jgi:hypothetical protein